MKTPLPLLKRPIAAGCVTLMFVAYSIGRVFGIIKPEENETWKSEIKGFLQMTFGVLLRGGSR